MKHGFRIYLTIFENKHPLTTAVVAAKTRTRRKMTALPRIERRRRKTERGKRRRRGRKRRPDSCKKNRYDF